MPSLLTRLVTALVPADEREALLGDLTETCDSRIRPTRGRWRANAWYAGQVAALCAHALNERMRRVHGPPAGLSWRDVRTAARALRRTPAWTTVAGLTLALGIGAATAVFSAVDPILLEPAPYPHPNRVVLISDHGAAGREDVTFGTFDEIARRTRSFEALGAADNWRPVLTDVTEGTRLAGQRVSAGYFRALGVAPLAGREFDDHDSVVNGPRVAMLSHALAARQFDGEATLAVGRQIRLNDELYSIVGVMPRDFENVIAPKTEIWAPLTYQSGAAFESAEWGHHLHMVGRIGSAVTLDEARQDVAAIAQARVAAFPRPPWADLSQGLFVDPVRDAIAGDVEPVLLAIVAAVGLVLAIVCVNVTNLLLARGAARRGELAVRVALGSTRARLVRAQLLESLLLSAIGGGCGLAVARIGLQAIIAMSPPDLPRVAAMHVDARVFAFSLAVTAFVGLAIGLVPALDTSRGAIDRSLRQSSRRTAGGRHHTRRALVVAEVGLAVVLLVSAGLLWRSVDRLFARSPGFDPSRALTMQVQTAGHRYGTDAARLDFFARVLDAVRAVPGVTSAAFTSQLPLSGDLDRYGVVFASRPNDSDQDPAAFRYFVTPDYFQAMRIPLRRGRLLDAHDRPGMTEAVLINEGYAARKFPGENPIGQPLRFGPEIGTTRPLDVIVGVVGNVKQVSLALDDPDEFYVASGQGAWVDGVQSLVVRTTGDAAALAPAVRRAIGSVDRQQPVVRVATLDQLVAASEAQRAFALRIFAAFAFVAAVLAALGLYGVLAGGVAERAREIGVRAALGASRANLLGLVIRQGLSLTALGIVIGLGGAVLASHAMTSLLFGISRVDPITYGGVIGVLTVTSAVACWVPAWRAAHVDPIVALRG